MGGKYAVRDNREIPDTLEVLWECDGPVLMTFAQYDCNAARSNPMGADIELRGTKGTMYIMGNRWEVVPEAVDETVAALKARLVHVNVNFRYLEDELHYIVDNADAKFVVFAGEFTERIVRGRAAGPERIVFFPQGRDHVGQRLQRSRRLLLQNHGQDPPHKQFGEKQGKARSRRPGLEPDENAAYDQSRQRHKEREQADAALVEEADSLARRLAAGKERHG